LGAGRSDDAGGTGGITAHAVWPGTAQIASYSTRAASGAPASMATMRFVVQGPGMTDMQQDFAAGLGTGTMSSVPVGTGRTLTMQGLNSSGTVLYTGTSAAVTVVVNATANAGAVTMAPATGQSVAPWPPTGLSATAGNGQITLTWTAATGATSYSVYRSTTTGFTPSTTNRIATGVTSAAYTNTVLSNGTTYYYVVTALNAAGESGPSAQVGATPQITAPGLPTGVAASPGDGQVTITWPAVAGATSYNLYWSTTNGAGTGGTRISGVTSPYTQTGRTNGTTYYYVVTAVNTVGESAASSQASATPQVATAWAKPPWWSRITSR
jgi:cellulose 1,4-beta-cellobiosidase